MAENLTPLCDVINNEFFNISGTTTINSKRKEIEDLQRTLRKAMRELSDLEEGKTKTMTPSMIESLYEAFPGLSVAIQSDAIFSANMNTPLMFHFGHTQNETTDPIYYVTSTRYNFTMTVMHNRRLKISNNTTFSLVDRYPLYRGISGNLRAHPHVSMDECYSGPGVAFKTICYGNNQFYDYVKTNAPSTVTPGNIIRMIRGFCIWARSANVLDMYDSDASPRYRYDEEALEDIDVDGLFAVARNYVSSLTADDISALTTGDGNLNVVQKLLKESYDIATGPISAVNLSYMLWLRKHWREFEYGRICKNSLRTAIVTDILTTISPVSYTEDKYMIKEDPQSVVLIFDAPRRLKEYIDSLTTCSVRMRELAEQLI